MSRAAVIDTNALVPAEGHQAPIYWGICGLMLIEGIVFSSLIASYLYLRLVADAWPPAGVDPPKLLLPSINTAVLVSSSFFIHKADHGIRKGDQKWLVGGLGAGIALSIVFLVLKYVEYSGLDYRWDSHAYGSISWTIAGFHSAHVIALLLKTIVMETLAIRGYFNEDRNIGVQVNGLYWHFVVGVWLPLYVLLYFVPRWL
jgi:cytochrome c oxidase subunit III